MIEANLVMVALGAAASSLLRQAGRLPGRL
jgi:hypothetical protein